MCYPKPGARCSAHTKRALAGATKRLREAEAVVAAASEREAARAALEALTTAKTARDEAQEHWERSPAGIRYLVKQSVRHRETDPEASARFAALSVTRRQEREAQMNAYHEAVVQQALAEQAFQDAYEGDWAQALRTVPSISARSAHALILREAYDGSATHETFARLAEEVKEVRPDVATLLSRTAQQEKAQEEEHREWLYEGFDEDGFANYDNSLRNTFTLGIGHNYLLEHGYTEKNGWSTDNPWGWLEEPILVDTCETTWDDEGVARKVLSEYEVRSVDLTHEDGRTAEVYRLEFANQGYDVFASREDCVAVLRENVGDISGN